ncbi:unnamed protein product [Miscanthus lutarioriparius]|uniref:Uncharacterized protein n=1 Tax=Miscanthus lutarioriparius TaxID=422564 RepID=A0A811NDL4_9POAL|nr:unnamed protein product [Miscanthus lutarioriparius]
MAGVHEERTGGSGASNGRRSSRRRPRRVLMFPLPFQGHINPMLQLGNVLHARGLAVTVLHTRLNALDPARRHPEFQFVPVLDGVPAHVAASGNVIDIIEAMNAAMEADGAAALRAVLESVVADEARPPAACIVFDANLLAVPRAAEAVGLRTLVLRTASAACLGCFLAYPMLHQKGYLPPQESKLYMPVKELPPLRVRDLFYSSWSNHKKMRELLARANEAMKNSSGLVINTLDALEKAELKRLCEELHIPVVLAPGPLHKLSSKRTRSSTPDQDYSCIEWLDKQPSESVLYVSFWKLGFPGRQRVLGGGLGLGQQWPPFSMGGSCRLGTGLLGWGKVIRWAPQQEVLAHPAVGGFWTHSGWNSTLESISEGVPMICRPQFADQMMNTRYVVNTWGVGLELEGELERGKIEKAVRKLMKDREERR